MSDSTAVRIDIYTDLVKKQIAIFGSDITFSLLARIPGLEVDKEGTVIRLPDSKDLPEKYAGLWRRLSLHLSKKIAEPELSRIPA